uniref:Uncharacterized protein n=1 Tax=Leersia perrieri TaxID=77586 RepID=A0A0D9W156_9ORYZ
MATGLYEEAAEKAFMYAETRFLDNDIAGALRAAGDARRLFRDLPGIDNVITAYEVHAASHANNNNYAVLAVGDRNRSPATAVSHDSLKLQYRRLCLHVVAEVNYCRSASASAAAATSEGDAVADADAAAAAGVGEVPVPRSLHEVWCQVHGQGVNWHVSSAVPSLQHMRHGIR